MSREKDGSSRKGGRGGKEHKVGSAKKCAETDIPFRPFRLFRPFCLSLKNEKSLSFLRNQGTS